MSIRLRLALCYAAFAAVLSLLFVPVIYRAVESELLSEVDRWLAPLGEQVVHPLNEHQGAPSAADDVPRLAVPASDPGGSNRALPSSFQGIDLDRLASPSTVIEVLDPNGRPLARSSGSDIWTVPVPDESFASAWWGTPTSFTTTVDGKRWRGLLAPISGQNEPRGFVLVAGSLQREEAALGRVRNLLVAGSVLGLLLAAGVGWVIARQGLRPVEEMTETVQAIALSRGFSRRFKVDNRRDEVGQLATTFNEMLASLEAAYSAQRRFVADASHELRSPLTSIRSNVEFLQRNLDAPKEDRAEALADVAAEADRMTRLISDLLLLARADAGHKIEMSRVALDDLLRDVHKQVQPRANGVAVESGPLRRTEVLGNAAWLKQLLLILVENALKYTPRGGRVALLLEREGDKAVIRVRDTGMGITPEDLPHVFDRFYRADKARARDEGGSGLGLSVAQWITQEHAGTIEVQSEVGKGTTFSVRIPAA